MANAACISLALQMSLIEELRRRFFKRRTSYVVPSLFYIVYCATGCRNIFIPDRHLDYVTDEFFKELYTGYAKSDVRSPLPWWDCDDRARDLWCYIRYVAMFKYRQNVAFGMLWTEGHALCLYVTPEPSVRFIEPANGRLTGIYSRVRFVIF